MEEFLGDIDFFFHSTHLLSTYQVSEASTTVDAEVTIGKKVPVLMEFEF